MIIVLIIVIGVVHGVIMIFKTDPYSIDNTKIRYEYMTVEERDRFVFWERFRAWQEDKNNDE